MHADEIDELERTTAARSRVTDLPAAVAPRTQAYDPLRFATWAQARALYPYHALMQVVDLDSRTQHIEPVFPMPQDMQLLDYQWEGVSMPLPSAVLRSADEIAAILRELDPGPYPPRQ